MTRGKGTGVVFRRSKRGGLREGVASSADLAAALLRDKQFRKEVVAALAHAAAARERAASRIGFAAAVNRLATDEALRQELNEMVENVRAAWGRLEEKQSHRTRNTVLVLLGTGAVAAAALPPVRRRATKSLPSWVPGTRGRSIEEAVEVDVPVSAAYNQLDQRRRQEDPRHRHVRTAGGQPDAGPSRDELPGRGSR